MKYVFTFFVLLFLAMSTQASEPSSSEDDSGNYGWVLRCSFDSSSSGTSSSGTSSSGSSSSGSSEDESDDDEGDEESDDDGAQTYPRQMTLADGSKVTKNLSNYKTVLGVRTFPKKDNTTTTWNLSYEGEGDDKVYTLSKSTVVFNRHGGFVPTGVPEDLIFHDEQDAWAAFTAVVLSDDSQLENVVSEGSEKILRVFPAIELEDGRSRTVTWKFFKNDEGFFVVTKSAIIMRTGGQFVQEAPQVVKEFESRDDAWTAFMKGAEFVDPSEA